MEIKAVEVNLRAVRTKAEAERRYPDSRPEATAFLRGAAEARAGEPEPALSEGVIRDAYHAGRAWADQDGLVEAVAGICFGAAAVVIEGRA